MKKIKLSTVSSLGRISSGAVWLLAAYSVLWFGLGLLVSNLLEKQIATVLGQSSEQIELRMFIFAFVLGSFLLMAAGFTFLTRQARRVIERKDAAVVNLEKRLAESKRFLAQSNAGTVSALLTALNAKDRYTARHSSNVAHYAVRIGQKLNLASRDLEVLETAAMLHDIGKIGIPEDILNKTQPLNNEEFDLIRRHSEIGAGIVHLIYFLEDVAKIILHHHERFDGTGYPEGLSGKEIPLAARILTVVDVYDALTTDRPYRSALGKATALQVLEQGKGTQFDPMVVSVFLQLLKEVA